MELEINGSTFRTIEMDAFTQFHIARKLGAAIPIIDGLTRKENATKDKQLLLVLMFGQLSDVDADFVVQKCLSLVLIKQGNDWAKVKNDKGQLMFDTITMAEILKLAMAVIEENLGDFFRTTLADLEATKPKT